jgi:hypothetical protein
MRSEVPVDEGVIGSDARRTTMNVLRRQDRNDPKADQRKERRRSTDVRFHEDVGIILPPLVSV